MSYPLIMLGGVEIDPQAGAPVEAIEPIGGSSVLRLSLGAGVKMQHWERAAGSISAEGWMPPGLDGLDFSQPLELRSTKIQSNSGPGRVLPVSSAPRPDFAPYGLAYLGREWVRTSCTVVDGVATLAEVPGATRYRVCWMPVFTVFATRPSETQTGVHAWSIAWEEA